MQPINEYILEDNRSQQAMKRIVDMLLDAYMGKDNRWHFPTVIGAAAALTGELSLLACHPAPQDTGYIPSRDVDDFLFDGAQSFSIFDLIRLDVDLSALPYKNEREMLDSISQGTDQSFGQPLYPRLNTETPVFPHEWPPNACPRFREAINELFNIFSLSAEERAWTMALATGELIGLSAGFAEKGMSSQRAREDILVRMAAQITCACARIFPLQQEYPQLQKESPLGPQFLHLEGKTILFAVTEEDGKITYNLRKDGNDYTIYGQLIAEEDRDALGNHGEIVHLSALQASGINDPLLEKMFRQIAEDRHSTKHHFTLKFA